MSVFLRCCSSRPRPAVSCCWWDRWLTASPPSSLGSSLRNYPGYSSAGTFKHVNKSKAIKETHNLGICRRKNDSSLPSNAAFTRSALHTHVSKIFFPQCCQLCAGQNPWIKLLQYSFHGGGASLCCYFCSCLCTIKPQQDGLHWVH